MSENTRRLERERVLSLLYEIEMKSEPADAVIAALPVRPESFVVDTVTGVDTESAALDELVSGYLIDWSIDRMTVIDRNVLRIGAWELQHRPDLSVAVVIAEAIELAKRFSTAESGKFVNGVLAAMAEDLR
jgi:N utilization substance protein B